MHTEVYSTCSADPSPLRHIAGKQVHLIGIGGSGMSGAAAMLLNLGARVSGSDAVSFPGIGALVAAGASIKIGHSSSHLHPDTALVVMSAAIPSDNPELAGARDRRIPVLKYAEFLAAFAAQRRTIAIAGTHGKSTTTGLTAFILQQAGLSPSFVLGGRCGQLDGGSGVGSGEHFVVEACEFDRSFLRFMPDAAAILNIEADHLDCFRDVDEIEEAFRRFASQVQRSGLLICNADDPRALRAAQAASARAQTVGVSEAADWRAGDLRADRGRWSFDVRHKGESVLRTHLGIPGRHNVSNALAAIALAYHAGASPTHIADAVPQFAGVDRRLSTRGEFRGIRIVDDYAHHPTEVRVTLEAARLRYEPRRMWVVFQPHQCQRTQQFMREFAASFARADEVVVSDVYGARESDPQACRAAAQELVRRLREQACSSWHATSLHEATEHVLRNVTEGDLVLTMGAGDVWKVADELVERLGRPNGVRRPAGSTDLVSSRGKSAVPIPAVR